jgi:CheY-like chemotaxis protein
MNDKVKSKEQLIKELSELRLENNSLKLKVADVNMTASYVDKLTVSEETQRMVIESLLNEKVEVHNNDKKLKILIAEDDAIAELFLWHIIKDFSKEVLKAGTGAEAVEICRNNPDLDLILMDIKMPEMDGYEATMKIREFNKKIVIIAQTAYAQTGDKQKAEKAGCNDYLSKPIVQHELLSLIKKYFNN